MVFVEKPNAPASKVGIWFALSQTSSSAGATSRPSVLVSRLFERSIVLRLASIPSPPALAIPLRLRIGVGE